MITFRKKNFAKNKITATRNVKTSNKNTQKFDYHLRLPFKMTQIEFKYIWTFLGFISLSIGFLMVLQSLTAYSSANLAPQKQQNVRIITNFGQKNNQSQDNVIQEFQKSTLTKVEIPKNLPKEIEQIEK